MSDRVVLSEAEIRDLARRALVANGASAAQAASLAQAIAAAERDGIPSHGLFYLATYCLHLGCGKVDGSAVPALTWPATGTLAVDARDGFAHLAIDTGLPALQQAAKELGIAVLVIRNSYNCGVLGYHTERIAQAGLVALGFTNAPASIAPWGARKAVLGTNPWSLAAPGRDGVALVIDQSASVVAKSEVMKRARAGEPLPQGWALDDQGRPTTDGAAALSGTMMPSGGYKGVGAALLVELMAACIAGATPGIHASPFSGSAGGPPRTGQCFIALDPGLTSNGAFEGRLAAVLAAFTAEPEAHLPGERRRAARAAAARGIAVDAALHAQALALTRKAPGASP